jgi:hypothetical protein
MYLRKSNLNDFFHADFSLEFSGRRQQTVRLDVPDQVGGRAHQRHAVAVRGALPM